MTYKFVGFSFGAGVQSTAILLLILKEPQRLIDAIGHLPNKIYFADTGAESEAIYQHCDSMQELIRSTPDAPELQVVSNGSILSIDANQSYWRGASTLPLYTRGRDGSVGMLRRQCTSEYKIRPIQKQLRGDAGYQPKLKIPAKSIGLWLGISIEEAHRMRDANERWRQNIYPLIELNWDRSRCYEYCRSHDVTPVKSRCYFCPFINDWETYKREQPEEFQKAVEYDRLVRNLSRTKEPAYIHRSCKPLDEAVNDQLGLFDSPDGFGNECTGMCGV